MTRADPDGRTRPRLITPPGSIPAIGGKHPVAAPPPLDYAPLGPVAGGSPGKGLGMARQDHQHPPQAVSTTTVASPHRATWLHNFGGQLSSSGTLAPGSSFVLGDTTAGGTVNVTANPSSELDTHGVYHVAVAGLYSVGVTAWVDVADPTGITGDVLAGFFITFGVPSGLISGLSSFAADSWDKNTLGSLVLPLTISSVLPAIVGDDIFFTLENAAFSNISLFPGVTGPGNGAHAVSFVYLLGTL